MAHPVLILFFPGAPVVSHKILMKKLLVLVLCLFPFLAFADQGQEQLIVTHATSGTTTVNQARSVTFIFRASFTGTINGMAFTSSDIPLRLEAQSGDTIGPITCVVSAGSLDIIALKRQ